MVYLVFFFSSRRRHTRWPRDWSSDVYSSDLRRHRRIQPLAFEGRGQDVFDLGGHIPDQGGERAGGLRHRGVPDQDPEPVEIGRASCRERVEISVVAVTFEKKHTKNSNENETN